MTLTKMDKNADTTESFDTWKQLFGDDPDATLQQLTDAIQALECGEDESKKTLEQADILPTKKDDKSKEFTSPFIDSSTCSEESDEFGHMVALCNSTMMDAASVTNNLRQYYGATMRMKNVDESTFLFIFANKTDARHAIRHQQRFPLLCLHSINAPEFRQHKHYVIENQDRLQPTVPTDKRPPTTMRVINNFVFRHLNIRPPLMTPRERVQKEAMRPVFSSQKTVGV